MLSCDSQVCVWSIDVSWGLQLLNHQLWNLFSNIYTCVVPAVTCQKVYCKNTYSFYMNACTWAWRATTQSSNQLNHHVNTDLIVQLHVPYFTRDKFLYSEGKAWTHSEATSLSNGLYFSTKHALSVDGVNGWKQHFVICHKAKGRSQPSMRADTVSVCDDTTITNSDYNHLVLSNYAGGETVGAAGFHPVPQPLPSITSST